MQFDEPGQPRGVAADPGIDGDHIGGRDTPVAQAVGGGQTVEDQLVQAVGAVGASGNVHLGRVLRQAGVGHDGVGDAVQSAGGVRMVGVELGQPGGHLVDGGVGVAVLVQKSVVLDLEAQVVDAVGHGVDQRLPTVFEVAAVVLDQMEPGLLTVFVVTVQQGPFGEPVGADPGVHRHHFGRSEDAVAGRARGGGSHQDDLVHRVCGGCTPLQIGRGVGAGEAGVEENGFDQLVKARTGASVRRRGGNGITAGAIG